MLRIFIIQKFYNAYHKYWLERWKYNSNNFPTFVRILNFSISSISSTPKWTTYKKMIKAKYFLWKHGLATGEHFHNSYRIQLIIFYGFNNCVHLLVPYWLALIIKSKGWWLYSFFVNNHLYIYLQAYITSGVKWSICNLQITAQYIWGVYYYLHFVIIE